MVRLMRGSADMAANLATPREIKGLRDAVQSADSDRLQGRAKLIFPSIIFPTDIYRSCVFTSWQDNTSLSLV